MGHKSSPRSFSHCHATLAALMTLMLVLATGYAQGTKPPTLPPLTTVPDNPRLPGKFVWADLVTDDISAAKKFYGALFGWSFSDYGGYIIAKNDERPVCGMFQRPRPADQPQARPRWFGYISVANVDKARNAVLNAGGHELAAPKKLPDRGQQAVFADAEGAIFGVVKSSSGDPEDFLADPGDWIWIQLLSRDAKHASEFYQAVGGYDMVENNSTNRQTDYILTSGGYARATVRTIRTDDARVTPNWLPFIRVSSVSESVAKARELGGKILVEPKLELLDGRVAVIADPTGAAIGLMEWSGEPANRGKTS